MVRQRTEVGTRIARARGADLAAVLRSLGAEHDRYDKAKWRIDGQVISVRGEKFYDHVAGCGGGGAIDLVMHVRSISLAEAVDYLDGRVWPSPPATRDLPAVRDLGQTTPFVPPRPAPEHWPGVRAYLVEERALPAVLIDVLHAQGSLYADGRRNAVFLRRDLQGAATGAALRGTRPGSRFKGLALGTDRAAGWFHFAAGDRGAPQMVLTESPIDTLSYYALTHGSCPPAGQGYRELYAATDGAGALPHPLIAWTLAHGGLVRVAFDRDDTGERLWQQLWERYVTAAGGDPTRFWREPPPLGKDWNDVLQARSLERSLASHGH
jgi:hypothetical protein